MIVVNFKTYASASGEAAEALLKAMSEQVNERDHGRSRFCL